MTALHTQAGSFQSISLQTQLHYPVPTCWNPYLGSSCSQPNKRSDHLPTATELVTGRWGIWIGQSGSRVHGLCSQGSEYVMSHTPPIQQAPILLSPRGSMDWGGFSLEEVGGFGISPLAPFLLFFPPPTFPVKLRVVSSERLAWEWWVKDLSLATPSKLNRFAQGH